MREGHAFAAPQFDQQLGVVTPRVNLFEAKHGGHVWQAPGMHVKHRRNRHVDVARAHQPRILAAADGDRGSQGVQHQLTMGEVHALGIAGGAGGVERRGDRVLVEVGEVVFGRRCSKQALVLADAVRQLRLAGLTVADQQGLLHGGQLPGDPLVEGREIAVDQDETILGMVHRVEDLLGRQAHVDGVHHRTDHRNGEHAFQVAMTVPVHHRHRIPRLDAGRREHIGQARDALVQRAVVEAQLVAVDDFTGSLIAQPGQQQALDQQRIRIGIGGGLDHAGLQHDGFLFLVGVVTPL